MKHFTHQKICTLKNVAAFIVIGLLLITPFKSHAQTVNITTVETVNKPCDRFSWYVNYSVNNPGANGGWIIQEVALKAKKDKCRPPVNVLNVDVTYYEIWPLAAGSSTSTTTGTTPGGASYNDVFSISGLANTKGSASWKGTVGYVANPAAGTSSIDTSTWAPGAAPYSGILLSTYAKPPFWDALAAGGTTKKHNMSLKWNCCDPKNTTWTFDTLIADNPKVIDVPIDDKDTIHKIDDRKDIDRYDNINGRAKSTPSSNDGINTDMNDLVNRSDKKVGFIIYPNPVENDLNIESTQKLDLPLSIKLYNTAGELIMEEKITSNERTIFSLDHLPKGAYVLSIYGKDNQLIQTHKVMR